MGKNRKRQIFTGAAVMAAGLSIIFDIIAYWSDYILVIDLIYLLIGILVSGGGLYWLVSHLPEKEDSMHFAENDFSIKEEILNNSKMRIMLGKFRNDFTEFFCGSGIAENADVQNDTTQIYKNVLDLQKRRLDRLGVKMEFRAIPRKYVSDNLQTKKYFDGKYEISEIKEEIEAKRRYSINGKTILFRTDSEAAHYTMINAKMVGEAEIICPSCGSTSDRENLIDGCDYCGVKFNVEDLGEKISNFGLRDDYQIAYQKYKEKRNTNIFWSALWLFFATFILTSIMFTILMFDDEVSGATHIASVDFMEPLYLIIGMIMISAITASIFAFPLGAVSGAILIPIFEIGARHKYNTKKKLSKLKKSEMTSAAEEKKVRKYDNLFSMTGFHSNIQNKLAMLYFANDNNDMSVFAEKDFSYLVEKYKNVIDMDVDVIKLENYEVDNELQKADVRATVTLYEINGNKAEPIDKKVKLRLVKNRDCKTQAVCAPSIMKCNSCGASLILAEGLKCRYCGNVPDLKKYDWTLIDYEEAL